MARKEYSDIAVETTLVGNLAIGGLSLTLSSATGYPAGTYQFVIKVDDELILCDTRSGTTVTINSAGRGFSGTTAIAHSNGAPVSHPWESHSATDLQRHVYDVAHDDHAQYQKESEKNQNNGYAGLDSSGVVPAARIDAAIARDTEVTSAVSTHTGAVDPHGDRAFATSAASSAASSAVTTHEADTTNVHGIVNTAALVLTGDARLSDTRVPTDGSVTQAKPAAGYRLTYTGTTAPSSPAEGDLWYNTTTSLLSVYNGASWVVQGAGAISTYTPTLRQNGSSITKTVNHARYVQSGPMVSLWVSVTATSAGTAGTSIDLSVPVPHTMGGSLAPIGGARMFRALSFDYLGLASGSSSSSSRADISFSTLVTIPAIASGDLISFIGSYLII